MGRHKGKPQTLYRVVMTVGTRKWTTEMIIHDAVKEMADRGDVGKRNNICISFRHKADYPAVVLYENLEFTVLQHLSSTQRNHRFLRR